MHAYLLHDGPNILRSSWWRCSTEQQGQQEECKSGVLHGGSCKQREYLISGPDVASIHLKLASCHAWRCWAVPEIQISCGPRRDSICAQAANLVRTKSNF